MRTSSLVASATLLAMAACQSAPALEPQQTALDAQAADEQQVTPPPEEVDLFSFAIETGRWSAMIDRARDGVREAPYPEGDEDLILRSDRSLKAAVVELVQLQTEACRKKLVTREDCNQIDVPDWAFEPATADADVGVLQRRSQWLGEALQGLTSVGCAAGREATGDEMFCAVE